MERSRLAQKMLQDSSSDDEDNTTNPSGALSRHTKSSPKQSRNVVKHEAPKVTSQHEQPKVDYDGLFAARKSADTTKTDGKKSETKKKTSSKSIEARNVEMKT